MKHARALPLSFVRRFRGWKATEFENNRSWYQHLQTEGQRPRAFVISCCDSRVNVTSLFEADAGEFFIHRNIANLVPAHQPDGEHHGTSAALEYAVTVLRVPHLLVIGHASCGGVAGCFDMCRGAAPELEERTNYLGRWLDLLRPAYDRVARNVPIEEAAAFRAALEKEGVLVSLENLMSFPFVAEAVVAERLSLHGLWIDIGSGRLEYYDGGEGRFREVTLPT